MVRPIDPEKRRQCHRSHRDVRRDPCAHCGFSLGCRHGCPRPTDPEELNRIMSTSISAPDSRTRLVLRRFLRRRLAIMGMLLVLAIFAFAYLGPIFYKWKYNQL